MQLHNFCKIIATLQATLQLLLKINATFFIFLVQQKLALVISHSLIQKKNPPCAGPLNVRGPSMCGAQFGKIGQIGLKPALVINIHITLPPPKIFFQIRPCCSSFFTIFTKSKFRCHVLELALKSYLILRCLFFRYGKKQRQKKSTLQFYF